MTVDLDALIDRLAALERENARLAAALDARPQPVGAAAFGTLRRGASATNRRGLLHAAAAIAAGATVGLVGPDPTRTRADNGQSLTLGQTNTATAPTALAVTQSFSLGVYALGVVDKNLARFPHSAAIAGHTGGFYGAGVLGYAVDGDGVVGQSDHGYGVSGRGTAAGVFGASEDAPGVYGTSLRHEGVFGFNGGDGAGVFGLAQGGPGVQGRSSTGDGLLGERDSDEGNGAGVHAVNSALGFALLAENINKDSGYYVIEATTAGDGGVIHAIANAGPAMLAQSRSGDGIQASSEGAGIGVGGLSNTGTGVYARSSTGESLRAEVLSGDSTAAAIHARHSGRGKAVLAEITNPLTSATAVSAKTRGTGAAVIGKSAQGHGGIFGGKQAPLRLLPRGRTHPRAGALGDLYVDTAGRLWFCTKTGDPATWRQLA